MTNSFSIQPKVSERRHLAVGLSDGNDGPILYVVGCERIKGIGAVVKTATLPQHDIAIADSLTLAAWVFPSAVVGGFIGGHLMHRMHRQFVRAIFIAVCLFGAWQLLTVPPAG